MTKIFYQQEHEFNAKSLEKIAVANAIIEGMAAQGYTLTLRQLYYQFVAGGYEFGGKPFQNTQREYNNLGRLISDARLAGLVDWEAIDDTLRQVKNIAYDMGSAAEMLEDNRDGFQCDRWNGQPFAPEVWIEKDALVNVIQRPCWTWGVPYFSCRGYSSQSSLWRAGKRMIDYVRMGREPVVIFLSDHDPSGLDMERDVRERLAMFAEYPVEIRRVALTREQIESYDPPPNYAKVKDSRARGYIAEFGDKSWELDALKPSVIEGLVDSEIARVCDMDKYDERVQFEQGENEKIAEILDGLKGA